MRRRLAQLLDRLDMHLKLLEAYLIVRDPTAPKSAEAFDGLRMKIDGEYKARRRHLAQLAELDRIQRTTGDITVVGARIAEFLQAEGVMTLAEWSPEVADAFDVSGPVGSVMTVHSPSYVEVSDGSLSIVKTGAAQAAATTPNPPERTQAEGSDVEPVQESEEVGE